MFLQKSPRLSAIRASSEGGSRRKAYKESQAATGFPNAKVQQIASSVLPIGSFVVVTFGNAYKVLIFSFFLMAEASTNSFYSADSFVESC